MNTFPTGNFLCSQAGVFFFFTFLLDFMQGRLDVRRGTVHQDFKSHYLGNELIHLICSAFSFDMQSPDAICIGSPIQVTSGCLEETSKYSTLKCDNS